MLFTIFWLISSLFSSVYASSGQVLGVHILNMYEVNNVRQLLPNQQDQWRYITIPFSYDDIDKHNDWQQFFYQAKEQKLIPLVRLATRFDGQNWVTPDRYQIVKMIDALSALDWPTDERYIIVFNEPNHAKEWGGKIDPVGYTEMLTFTSDWAKTEEKNFKILAAGLDLAANNSSITMDSTAYLSQMIDSNEQIFDQVDFWNSHSYPNPGFSSSPQRVGKNSLSGFKYELDLIKTKTGKDFQVFITETGWEDNKSTNRYLQSYYTYALQHVWSDPRIVAVTPFLLQGSPGPFAKFSFLDENGQPTSQYLALQKALEALN